jgi:hypothetical protein
MKKKRLLFALAAVIVLFIILIPIHILTYGYDRGRIESGQPPKFCVKLGEEDVDRYRHTTYCGIGYKIIKVTRWECALNPEVVPKSFDSYEIHRLLE